MKKSSRNLLIGTGIAAAGIGAVAAGSYKVMKSLVDAALNREKPELVTKVQSKAGSAKSYTEVSDVLSSKAEDLESSGCETVEIQSHDGLNLVGHWYSCAEPKRVIVAMHGWRSTWASDFGVISGFWHSNDCCVLYAEQRAQGESEGEYMSFGLAEQHDCLAWVNWVNERTGGTLPIYLCGVSMGATTVLLAAGMTLPANVKGVIADCGFTSIHGIWYHVVNDKLHIPYNGLRSVFAEKLCRQRLKEGTKDHSTVDAMERCRIPVLFIHGMDDTFVPPEMTDENYEACTAPKRKFLVPGAKHGMSYLVDQEGYEREVRLLWNYAEDPGASDSWGSPVV